MQNRVFDTPCMCATATLEFYCRGFYPSTHFHPYSPHLPPTLFHTSG